MEFVNPPKQELGGIGNKFISCFMSNQTQELPQTRITNELLSCLGQTKRDVNEFANTRVFIGVFFT